jgi:group I intron endonuclease
MEKVACIYKIKSKCKPERIYIGSAADAKTRWDKHSHFLKKGRHHSHKLQNHVNKYGFDDLEFSVVAVCDSDELIPIDGIIRPEQFFIWAYDPWFNECKIAGSRRGMRVNDETKQKISESLRNRPPISDETRKKLSAVHKGKKQSAEEVARKSERMKGHPVSEETRRKISISHKGKPLGELHRIRTIKALTGRPVSEETRRKISLKHKGRKVSEGAKEKMREVALRTGRKPPSRKGKSVPQEIRDKISEGMKRHKRLKDQNKNAA